MIFRKSKKNEGYIGASEHFEKKDKMTSLYGRYGPGSGRIPNSKSYETNKQCYSGGTETRNLVNLRT